MTFFVVCSIGSLLLWDYATLRVLWPGMQDFWALVQVPEKKPDELGPTPALYRGFLATQKARTTPNGETAALYYGWIEDHYRSGRSTTTRVLCRFGEDEDLFFQQGSRRFLFQLFHHGERIEVLKHTDPFEDLHRDRIGIDLGPLSSKEVSFGNLPEPLRQRCPRLERPRGTLFYKEMALRPDQEVIVLSCGQDRVFRSCPNAPALGFVAADSIDYVYRAYGNDVLNGLRGVLLGMAFSLGFLCSLLLKYSRSEADS